MALREYKLHDCDELRDGLLFPEAPRWREDALWHSDLGTRTVSVLRETGELVATYPIEDVPSGLGFLPDGTPVVVGMQSKQLLFVRSNDAQPYASLESLPGAFLNDMLMTPSGVAYIGVRRHIPPTTARDDRHDFVAMVGVDGVLRIAAEDVAAPNGFVLTRDGQVLLVAETQRERVLAFDVDIDGSLSGRRVYANIAPARPDGICMDRDGAVWCASPLTREVLHISPSGEHLARIDLGHYGGIACTLGGRSGTRLFLLIARVVDGFFALINDNSPRFQGPEGDAKRARALTELGLDGRIVTLDVPVGNGGLV